MRSARRLEVLPGFLGHPRARQAARPLHGTDVDGLLVDALELHAEVLALRELFEDAEFLAWALQRALAGKPDLRLLVRHVHEQLRVEAQRWPMG